MIKSYSNFLCQMTTLTLMVMSICLTANATITPNSKSLAPILKKVMPTVVNIDVTAELTLPDILRRKLKRSPEGKKLPDKHEYQKLGSGVIIDAKKGYIITNAHVVKDGKKIMVNLNDGQKEKAKLIGIDNPSDIAVLQIKADHLTSMPFGDSSKVQVGDFVVAIGSPYGLKQTVTSGIVSAKGRDDLMIEGYENFIQTDAAINPGNSGGALINMQGQLIGINTAIVSATGANAGIGFAIPANMAKSIADQIIKYGSVKRGILGLYGQPLTPELAKAFDIKAKEGVVITTVAPNSAASIAGLKMNDIITTVDGQTVKSVFELRNVIGLVRADNKVKIKYLRDGKAEDTTVKMTSAEHQTAAAKKTFPYFYGVSLARFDGTSSDQIPVKGMQVRALTEESSAYQAGIRAGDIIVQANQEPASSMEALKSIINASKGTLLLNVRRGPSAFFVVLKASKS